MEKDDITLEQLEKFVQKGAIIIDVRSPQEYNEGHIDNAICIPNYEIEKKIRKIVTDFNKTIIVRERLTISIILSSFLNNRW